MSLDAVFAVCLPVLVILLVTSFVWLPQRRRRQRERAGMTFRPWLILRVAGWVIAVIALLLLLTPVIGNAGPADTVVAALCGGLMLVVGVVLAGLNSSVLQLGPTSLWYRKFFFVTGEIDYRDIDWIADERVTLVRTVTIHDFRGHAISINAGLVDWTPLMAWIEANGAHELFDSRANRMF